VNLTPQSLPSVAPPAGKSALVRRFLVAAGADASAQAHAPLLLVDPSRLARPVRVRFVEPNADDAASADDALRTAAAVVLAYDVGSAASFGAAGGALLERARRLAPGGCLFLLIGCRSDVAARAVPVSGAEALARREQLFFLETSAREGTNVELALTILRIRLGAAQAQAQRAGAASTVRTPLRAAPAPATPTRSAAAPYAIPTPL
jgi:hypothetical protein